MRNIPGDPHNYPANIRAIEDGDNRNATNLAAAVEDLADRTASTARLTTAARGIAGDMQAVTDAINGDLFFVRGLGWYCYNNTLSIGAADPPRSFAPTGMGSGLWVIDWASFFLPGIRTVAQAWLSTDAFVAQAISGSSYTQVADTAAVPLSATIPNVHTDDVFKIHIGPFDLALSAGDQVTIRVRVLQGSTTTNHALHFESSIAAHLPVDFHFGYKSVSTSNVQLYLETRDLLTGSSVLGSPLGSAVAWGPSPNGGLIQWGSCEQTRMI